MTTAYVDAQVEFHIPEKNIEAIHTKATELDDGDGPPYTLGQALQIVWHMEPEWLHKQLTGWVFNEWRETAPGDTVGRWRHVWGEGENVLPPDHKPETIERWLSHPTP